MLAVISTLVFFILCHTEYLVTDTDSHDFYDIWLLHSRITDERFWIICIITTNMFNFLMMFFPVLVTFVLSSTWYKFAEVLEYINNVLQTSTFTKLKWKNFQCFEDFIEISNILREMNIILNYPIFFLVIYSLVTIFISFCNFILLKDFLDYTLLLDIALTFASSIVVLLMYCICGSKIPEKLSEIRLTVRVKINRHVFGLTPPISQSALLCLRRMEMENLIYITVCGTFRLTKSFIFLANGTIFTYDLLIINVFPDTKTF